MRFFALMFFASIIWVGFDVAAFEGRNVAELLHSAQMYLDDFIEDNLELSNW